MRGGRNVIPVTVVARREAILDAGGFQPMDRFEDYALWLRMLELGHRFAYVKRETWTYRFLGGNRTWDR
jgi:cellulose synthase/poly-beta-1,6-N-acetylglucosamine synthase-like glycosyltransferase